MIVFALIIALFAIWLASIISFVFALPYAHFLLPGPGLVSSLGFINVFVVLGVPVLLVLLRGIRFLFRRPVIAPRWRASIWGFWGLNVICLFALASFTARQFSEGEEERHSIAVEALPGDTLRLQMTDNIADDAMLDFGTVRLSDRKLHTSHVYLNIERSKNGQFELEQRQYSRGESTEEAIMRANNIQYQIEQEAGTLVFPRGFILGKGEKWRGQRVDITLRIPEGKYLVIEREANRLLHEVDVEERGVSPWRYRNRVWKMGPEGLICSECPESTSGDRQFDHRGFNQVQIEGEMKVEINEGEDFDIRLTGREVYTSKVEIVQSGENLTISSGLRDPSSPVRLTLTIPELRSLDLDGTDDVKINGFTQAFMRIKSVGEDNLKAMISVDSLNLFQGGSTEFDIRGRGKYLKASLAENSELDAEYYTVKDADVTTRDYSQARVSVTDTLRENQKGYGWIKYVEEPRIVIDSQ